MGYCSTGVNFGVNARVGAPLETIGNVTVNTCESWTIMTEGEHPFHAHAGKFYITSMNNTAVDENVWRDTYIIDAAKSPLEIKICYDRIKPCDILLVHCNDVSHLDIGMFTQLLAVDEDGMCTQDTMTETSMETPEETNSTETPTATPSSSFGKTMTGFVLSFLFVIVSLVF